MSFVTTFLKDTLGWQQYPVELSWPLVQAPEPVNSVSNAGVIVVLQTRPSQTENELLKKMLGAVGVTEFQVIDLSSGIQIPKSKKTICFGVVPVVGEPMTCLPGLSEFFGPDIEKIKSLKKDAWDKIRHWHGQPPSVE